MITVLIPSTPERTNNLKRAIESIKGSIFDYPIYIKTEISSGEGATKPLIRLLKSTEGLVLGFSDDVTIDPHCIRLLYESYLEKFPNQDGLCCINNPEHRNLFGCYFFGQSKTLLDAMYPGYVHNFQDKEITEKMKARDKLHFVANTKVIHYHPNNNLATVDETHKFALKNSDADGALYAKRFARGFVDKETINILIPSTPERKERLEKAIASIKNSICNQTIEIKIDISEGEGANKPLVRLLNETNGLVIGFSDDMLVRQDTIQIMYDAYIENFPDRDGIVAPYNCDVFLAHSDTEKKYWCPDYTHLYTDRDFFDIMTRLKKIHRVDAVIDHEHYTKNALLTDDTYRFSEAHREEDKIIYEKRKANNFYLD